jgi:hypothetical protein
MLRELRRRLSYANVVSTLCLFLVVAGGTAYAANTVLSTDIVDGEVKTPDLANVAVTNAKVATNAVSAGKLASSAVTNGKIAGNAVTSGKVADGTLTGADIAVDSIGSADLAPGSVGTSELANESVSFAKIGLDAITSLMFVRQVSTATDTTAVKELQADCGSVNEVSGGGFVISGPGGSNVPSVVVQRSYAVDANHWLVRAAATSGAPTWQLTVVANCVSQ